MALDRTPNHDAHERPVTDMAQALRRAGFQPSHLTRRTFALIRGHDVNGVSGCGLVAEGAVFADGAAVLRWLGAVPTTTIFDSVADIVRIHGHGGSTRLVFDSSEVSNG